MNTLKKEKLLQQDLVFLFYDNCNNNFLYARPIAHYLDKNKQKKVLQVTLKDFLSAYLAFTASGIFQLKLLQKTQTTDEDQTVWT